MSFSADVDIRKYMAAMRFISKEALPDAVAESLNAPAEAIEKAARKNVKRDLTIRTKFTVNSIRQDRHARGQNIERMFSRVGSISPYLWMHDKGYKAEGISGDPLPIPTTEARTSKSIQRAISKKYRIGKNERIQPGMYSSIPTMFTGKPKGGDRPYGIYKRANRNNKLVMLRNLEHDDAKIPATHWFSKPVKKYGSMQFIKAQFIKIAKRKLSGLGK